MKSSKIPDFWKDKIELGENRYGILIKIPRTRLMKTDNAPIRSGSYIFNNLPKEIRCEVHAKQFIDRCKEELNSKYIERYTG